MFASECDIANLDIDKVDMEGISGILRDKEKSLPPDFEKVSSSRNWEK
jgi:hypothetical protein